MFTDSQEQDQMSVLKGKEVEKQNGEQQESSASMIVKFLTPLFWK